MGDIIDKKYVVTMPDGSKWAVPVRVIAQNRAESYAGDFDDSADVSLEEDTLPLFESDDAEIEDWARNNMDWSEVVKEAKQVAFPPPMSSDDFQDGWANGEVEVVDG
jgi:hypothetical protein